MRKNDIFNLALGRIFSLGAAAIFFVAGCSSMPEVTTYRNPITGSRTDVLAENLLDTGEETPREMVWLNAYRDFKNNYEYTYYLEAIYGAREETGYLDIGPGRTLTIVVDGEELNFSGLGSLSRDKNKGVLFEHARYEVSPSDLDQIAGAKKVTVRLSGKNGSVVREFGPENFEKFKKFMEQTGGM